jgi:D-alanyl-D-alanine carboxypeptidase/D-alanyl-D-alanine-endopeptidase (penicillin-binding protein 4)
MFDVDRLTELDEQVFGRRVEEAQPQAPEPEPEPGWPDAPVAEEPQDYAWPDAPAEPIAWPAQTQEPSEPPKQAEEEAAWPTEAPPPARAEPEPARPEPARPEPAQQAEPQPTEPKPTESKPAEPQPSPPPRPQPPVARPPQPTQLLAPPPSQPTQQFQTKPPQVQQTQQISPPPRQAPPTAFLGGPPTARITPDLTSRLGAPPPPVRPMPPGPERVEVTQHIPVIRDEPRYAPTDYDDDRALPQRIGPDDYDDDDRRDDDHLIARPRRRGRRWLVIAGIIVVVIAVGVGVVFAAPGVATKLGLGSIVPPTTAAPPSPVAVNPAIGAPSGPEPSAAGVNAKLASLAGNPALGTFNGEVLDATTGNVLWDHGSGNPSIPASTNKVLTSAAALLALNPLSTLDTQVVAGPQPGTIVLVGGGDPTLSLTPDQATVYTQTGHISDLAAQVKQHVSGTISKIIVDTSAYTGPTAAPGWLPGDIAGGNYAPMVSAMLNAGRTNTTNPDSPRVADPSQALGDALANALGVSTSAVSVGGTATSGAQVLGVVHSESIQDLVGDLLRISDNVLAEALGRAVAKADGQPESFDGATKAVHDVLSRNGFDVGAMSTVDASGLSPSDHVPPTLLTSVLRAAAAPDGAVATTPKLRPVLAGLPIAGATGTLAPTGPVANQRFNGSATSGRGWVRAKTGTLPSDGTNTLGVNTLAGIVLDSDGRVLVFAFMSANSASWSAGVPYIDRMAAALHGCGCQ